MIAGIVQSCGLIAKPGPTEFVCELRGPSHEGCMWLTCRMIGGSVVPNELKSSHAMKYHQKPFHSPIQTSQLKRGLNWLPFGGRTWFLITVSAATLCLGAVASAGNGQPITRIEEDWKITFGVPDPDLNAPQVSMTMAPSADLNAEYVVFSVNHRTQPDYIAGGLQLQRFFGENCLDYNSSQKKNLMQVSNDVVTFTMSMQVQNGSLTYAVSNGNSQTWGTFGSNGDLALSMSYGASDLSAYDSTTSLNNSQVNFAPNRVQQVARTQVRYYSNGTLVSTDNTQQVTYQYTGG